MCLITNKIFPTLAFKDIKTYKVLLYTNSDDGIHYYTPYQRAEVKIGSTLRNIYSIFNGIKNKEIRGSGVHSILNKEGLYSWLSDINFCIEGKWVVVKCTIPKWSWYYKGIYNDIASNKLRIDDIIPSYKLFRN